MSYIERATARNVIASALLFIALVAFWKFGDLIFTGTRLQIESHYVQTDFQWGKIGVFFVGAVYDGRIDFIVVTAWSWITWLVVSVAATLAVWRMGKPRYGVAFALALACLTLSALPPALIARAYIVGNSSPEVYGSWKALDAAADSYEKASFGVETAVALSLDNGEHPVAVLLETALLETLSGDGIVYAGFALVMLSGVVFVAGSRRGRADRPV